MKETDMHLREARPSLQPLLFAEACMGRTGIGNMLLIWARAEIYCARTGARMLAPQWFKPIRIGPWLRREQDKRYYLRQFCNSDYVHGWRRWRLLLSAERFVENQGDAAVALAQQGRSALVSFRWPTSSFNPLLPHRAFLRQRLVAIVHPRIRDTWTVPVEDFIGVHVRRGDFCLVPGGTVGCRSMATPDDWYLRCIANIRQSMACALPVLVFSDAARDELRKFETLTDVRIMPPAPAMLDILRLSRSRVLIASARSTFSQWAAFLGNMPSIWPTACSPGWMNDAQNCPAILADEFGNLPPTAQEKLKCEFEFVR